MKISFDFDGTLSTQKIQDIAKILIDSGNDVWIITSRNGDPNVNNVKVYDVCDKVGIPKQKIIFTNLSPKVNEYAMGSFDLHFDDDWEEVEKIIKNGGNAVLVNPDFEEIFKEQLYRENINGWDVD